jgi:hypothetical protein
MSWKAGEVFQLLVILHANHDSIEGNTDSQTFGDYSRACSGIYCAISLFSGEIKGESGDGL